MNPIIIDVREKDEFDAEHIENSIHIPLSTFGRQAPAIFRSLNGQKILLMCLGGKRAGLAAQQALSFCDANQMEVFQGGILEWKKQGKPIVATRKNHLPIMRQVQITAGSLVVLGVALAHWVNPAFIFLSGFVGAGVAFAGATGFCAMAEMMAKMPWNQSNPKLKDEMCSVSPSGSCSKE